MKKVKLNIIQIIHDELNNRGLTTKHLARLLGLSESQLNHKLQNFSFFSAIELAKIKKLLKLKPSLIFRAIEEGEKAKKEGALIFFDGEFFEEYDA